MLVGATILGGLAALEVEVEEANSFFCATPILLLVVVLLPLPLAAILLRYALPTLTLAPLLPPLRLLPLLLLVAAVVETGRGGAGEVFPLRL